MTHKDQDPNLQAPQEANTTKHVNFLEAEEAGTENRDDDTDDSFDDSPTKKAWEELRRDKENQQNSKE